MATYNRCHPSHAFVRVKIRSRGDTWRGVIFIDWDWSKVYDDRFACERAALKSLDVPMRDVVFEVQHG